MEVQRKQNNFFTLLVFLYYRDAFSVTKYHFCIVINVSQ